MSSLALGGAACTAPTETKALEDGEVVGPAGGTLATKGLTLVIPAGALDEPRELSVRTLASPPEGLKGPKPLGQLYRFEPAGLVFKRPVAIVADAPPSDGTLSGALSGRSWATTRRSRRSA